MQNYDHAIEKARQLAQTPEGKQLIENLQQMGGRNFQKMAESAASGDYSAMQQELARIAKDPQIKKLLESMEW